MQGHVSQGEIIVKLQSSIAGVFLKANLTKDDHTLTGTDKPQYCHWSCRKLQRYWSNVLSEIEKILGLELKMEPESLVLGLPSRYLTSQKQKEIVLHSHFCCKEEHYIGVD